MLPLIRISRVLAGVFCLAGSAVASPLVQKSISDDLTLSDLPTGGTLSTISGDLTLGSVSGPLSIRTVSGNITVRSATDRTEIHTVSGDVRLGHADGSLTIHAISGDMSLGAVNRDVNIKSTSGDVVLTVPAPAGTPRIIDLTTVSGDVTLHLSPGFSGTFNIRAVQSSHDSTFPVEQALGLTVATGEWESHVLSSTKTRTVTVTGSVNGGRDQIHIKTTSGKVRLVQD
ncbi:DUF4097 family beta strand repeat-containing protein [Gluconobacter morbifer]|nr:DUF4097 family beta strand repeat-containing protein [Gluconobacter morbifer]